MAFWTENTVDPKRQYRFQAFLPYLGESGCTWFIKSVGKPNLSISEASHEYLNHTFYYPGRASWNTVSITLVDPVEPDAAAIMMSALEDAGYKVPSGPDQKSTMSKSNATDRLGEVEIRQFDGTGENILEKWILKNAWIKNVSLGDLDYSGDGISEVTIEIRYDWAQMEAHGSVSNSSNIGTARSKDQGIFKQQ